MHPPLDRPHPDCEGVVQALKACHADAWKKFTGGCNETKFELDRCFKVEKRRLLNEMNKDLDERRTKQEEIMREAFGRSMTFSEYLEKDKESRAAKSMK